jgi:hypothetical protein
MIHYETPAVFEDGHQDGFIISSRVVLEINKVSTEGVPIRSSNLKDNTGPLECYIRARTTVNSAKGSVVL